MPTLPEVIVTMLLPFEHLFDPRTWRKAQLLVVGAILSPGKRTVSSALNILGVGQHGDFALYHQVLNRARWSPLQLSRVLLLLVAGRLGSSNEPLVFGIDETVERRWGRKIAAKGRYRDVVRSTDDQVVMTPGLQWVSLMLLTRIGWAGRHWALPFLTALATSARYDRRKGRRHKMVTDYAQQIVNFHGHGPGLTTVIDPPWKHGDLIDSRLLLVGQSPPSVLSRARCGDSRSL